MNEVARKKSPRSPAFPLEDCLEKVLKIYEKEKGYDVNTDTVARHAGYKDGKSGASLSFIAALGYFGLTVRRGDGVVAVSPDVREYKVLPDHAEKQALLVKWLKSPAVFRELLEDDFPAGLPSDPTLRYTLIKKGYSDKAADDCLKVFKRSVEFVGYYDINAQDALVEAPPQPTLPAVVAKSPEEISDAFDRSNDGLPVDFDEIPVRLGNGRRAWLRIPTPFYERDKARLKKQIDLILTEDEDDSPELQD